MVLNETKLPESYMEKCRCFDKKSMSERILRVKSKRYGYNICQFKNDNTYAPVEKQAWKFYTNNINFKK